MSGAGFGGLLLGASNFGPEAGVGDGGAVERGKRIRKTAASASSGCVCVCLVPGYKVVALNPEPQTLAPIVCILVALP